MNEIYDEPFEEAALFGMGDSRKKSIKEFKHHMLCYKFNIFNAALAICNAGNIDGSMTMSNGTGGGSIHSTSELSAKRQTRAQLVLAREHLDNADAALSELGKFDDKESAQIDKTFASVLKATIARMKNVGCSYDDLADLRKIKISSMKSYSDTKKVFAIFHALIQKLENIAINFGKAINEDFNEDDEVFTEGALAEAIAKTPVEMYKLSVPPTGVKLIATGINTAINATTAKWFLTRAKNYTLLHPEITPINEFNEERYSLPEAVDKFNIKFQFANKWAEKINTRVDVRVFSFHNIPQFAVAYAGKTSEHKYNSEFVWITNQFKKYDDFYTACAHCKVRLGHPAINRMVKKMLADWKKTREQSKKYIKESVEEAVINGTYSDKIDNLNEAIRRGIVSKENAMPYFEAMEIASIQIDNEWW